MKKNIFLIFYYLCFSVNAQNTLDSVLLDTTSLSLNFSTFDRNQLLLDSILIDQPNADFSEVLRANTPLQLNQYGEKGGVGSLSIRGFNSSQNQINWNGLPINSLTLGMFDLAGLKSSSFSSASITWGSSAHNFGSGAIGGVIQLDNKVDWKTTKSIQVGSTFGAFERGGDKDQFKFSSTDGFLRVVLGGKRWQYQMTYQNEYAENDYVFHNLDRIGNPRMVQKNARFKNSNLVNALFFKHQKHQFSFVSWLAGREKFIPPLTVEPDSRKIGTDSAARFVLGYQLVLNQWLVKAKYGLMLNQYTYSDPELLIFSRYVNREQFQITEAIGCFGSVSLKLLNRFSHHTSLNSNFLNQPKQIQNFSSAQLLYQRKKLSVNAKIGSQYVDLNNTFQPFYGTGYSYQKKNWNWFGGVASHYRLPSFNDLYWIQGGNSELKPESGWGIDDGIGFQKNFKKWLISLKSTFFFSAIDQWIRWVPGNGGVWRPENVQSVWSRGAELGASAEFRFNKWKLNWTSNWNYTHTTIQESNNSFFVGKQLRYVPFWNGSNQLVFSTSKVDIFTNIHFQGLRYTSEDNTLSQSLPSNTVLDLSFRRKMQYKHHQITIQLRASNLLNANYQVVDHYAMPGRSYDLTIIYQFKPLTKQNKK